MAGLINASSVTMACSLMSHRASRGLSGKKELALEAEGPVGAELRRGGVHEDLGGEVHRVDECAGHNFLADVKANERGPDAPFALTEVRAARGREGERRPDAPDETFGICR